MVDVYLVGDLVEERRTDTGAIVTTRPPYPQELQQKLALKEEDSHATT